MITPNLLSTTCRKLSILFVLFGLFLNTITAQTVEKFTGERINNSYEAELSAVFQDYDIFEIESTTIANYVRAASGDPMLVNLELADEYNWEFVMYENDLISQNYQSVEHSDNGSVFNNLGGVKTLTGHLQSDLGGMIHLTVNDNFLMGMIHDGGKSFFIEPLKGIVAGAPNDLYVVYNTANAIAQTNATCGVQDVAKYRVKDNQGTNLGSSKMDECSKLEMALAADRSMFNKYGSVTNVEDYLIGIFNLVAPDYIGFFSQDIEFDLVTIFVVTGTDPWVSGTDASALLNDFSDWGVQGNFGVNYDLGQLWSDRNLSSNGNSSTVGVAFLGVVCNPFAGYSIIEDFSNSSNFIRQTVSHELGHNFDADHDAAGGNIMAPAVNGSSSWSNNSINVISNHIDTRTCFDDCLECLDITSFEIQNCGNGVYDIEVCIEHTNRNNQSDLEITANGSTSSFGFNSTGVQCEVISGLNADGTLNAVLTVRDANDNDIECTKTANYNAPFPECFCTPIISENFDALALPAGWTNVGSGNNPNGEWDFGDATLGFSNGGPAGSFDGSGMAFWDDDANGNVGNGSEFMELTTPPIDLTNFEGVSLDFDYNFRTFTGGDAFLVDVWNGNSWVNLLTVDDDDCGAWGCDHPHFTNLNMDIYANPNFQIRFTYDDSGNSWQWYVGIDNVELCGFPLAALPIDLVQFDARDNENCTVELNWETGVENTSDVIEVERSFDGEKFEVIGSFDGLLNPAFRYNFIDENPGYENFYRLKSTSLSGEIDFSTIKAVTAKSCEDIRTDILEVYPNPTNADLFFNIQSSGTSNVRVEIRNTAGQLVDVTAIQLQIGINNQSINTDRLASGIYYIQMIGDFGISSIKKFVKE